jgi:hypothetical protein
MAPLTETEAGHVFGGQPGLQTELLSEKDRVRIVHALHRAYLDLPTAAIDWDAVDLALKLADPRIAVWLQRSTAP